LMAPSVRPKPMSHPKMAHAVRKSRNSNMMMPYLNVILLMILAPAS
jgi:hypothetical protein